VDSEPLGELHQLTDNTDTQILAWLNTHRLTTVADVALSARILPLKNAAEWGLVWRSFSRSDKMGLQFMAFTFELTDQDRGVFKYSIRVNETFKRSFSSNFSPFLQGKSCYYQDYNIIRKLLGLFKIGSCLDPPQILN
jgi:hypothetical protein